MGTKRKQAGQHMHNSTRVEQKFIKNLISLEFHFVPPEDIQKALDTNDYDLRRSYLELSDMVDYWDVDDPPWAVKCTAANTSRKTETCLMDIRLNDAIRKEMNVTLQALREERKERLRSRIAGLATKGSKQRTSPGPQSDENSAECECCFGSFPRSGMTRCNAEKSHWFCVQCACRNAEAVVGRAQHEIRCMSIEPCGAGFSQQQRKKFIDDTLQKALDRIEAKEVKELLARKGVEPLSQCPFCGFAAIYPLSSRV
ncbi:hypothetical protein MRS44_018581 [Fusarium solani]|uniref:uncharacterized protein n=1 Tax=Fusarium solani TaxID=169388 RepID=UPI0032C3D8C4|nr:hypothetical protein MRS44_018581 [Fusarium solani]